MLAFLFHVLHKFLIVSSRLFSFREKAGTWTGVAQNEWLQGNTLLLAEIPPQLKSQESNLEVSERLRQLSAALKKTRTQEIGF